MKPIYYGWFIVAYAVLCQMLVVGSTLSAFGLYVVPVSAEFGLSRANMNTVIILLNVGGMVMAPVIGWLLDRMPLRPILIAGAIAVGLSFAALSVSHWIWLSAIIIGLFMTAGDAAAVRPPQVLIVRWFEANRGRALTLGAMGLSFAGILIAPAVGYLVQNFGWRTSLLICGGVISAAVLLPALIIRARPTAEELAREAKPGIASDALVAERQAKPMAVRALLRMPQFWCIGLAIAIPMAVSQAVLISMVPMAVESGLPLTQAATLISAAGLMALSGKFVLAVIADKVNRMALLTSVFVIGAIENVLLFTVAGDASYTILLVCAVMQGLSAGMLMPLFNALVAERFGPASFGTVAGLMFLIISIMCAILARFAGEVFDRTGAYNLAFATFVVLELAAAGLMFFSRRFAKPATMSVIAAKQ